MPPKYKIVITGLKPGVGETETRANLARLLKAPAEKIDRLLDSLPAVIKKNVERELGEKYVKVLAQAGVLAEIKPETLELSLAPAEDKPPEATSRFTCPQCGDVVQQVGKCSACVEKNAAARINASSDRKVKRRERNQKIKQSAVSLLINWIRGNVWKAGLVFILLPFFGSSFLVSSVFHTRDKHLVYQTLSSRTVCVKDPTNMLTLYSNTDKDLADLFWREFDDEEKKEVLEKWGNVACRAIYEMELGNIGDEPVTTNIRFASSSFVTGSKARELIVHRHFRNLSSATPREQDPVVKHETGVFRLENIYPNTLVSLKFGGWVDDKDSAVAWERMLIDVNVDEGLVEVGDPLATTFGRLLTAFF